ncbi:hypothetical protein ACFVWG_29265 [Kribbella sp. NPDC058245]|uniref:hypothetical protein n=1 Tax=Kribbella sp. NPDC058245 TaxID=3346399 RepID=UPI0036E1BA10
MTVPGITVLRHNPLNAVTETVERLTYADGRTAIRKRLRRPVEVSGDPWAASVDPRHWNYWRREVEVYRDEELRAELAIAGLLLPGAEVVEDEGGAVLVMEDVIGLAATAFGLAEHEALARACGRWQARPPQDREWTSQGFLRGLLDDACSAVGAGRR